MLLMALLNVFFYLDKRAIVAGAEPCSLSG